MAVNAVTLFLFGLLLAVANGTTPVEKVVQLLKQLQTQVETEGKVEAAQYDKYSCFCKEQADEKLYRIEKSDKKIAKLGAKIEELDSEMSELNGEIKALATSISDLATKIEDATKARATEHEEYLSNDKDMRDAIDAIKRAIAALKDSKGKMEGAKLDLHQVQAFADRVLDVMSRSSHLVPSHTQLQAVAALSQLSQPNYEYRSNDIIATLEGLFDLFNKNKKDRDFEEFDLQAAHDKRDLNMRNEKEFQEKDKVEKEKIVEAKTEEKHLNVEDKNEETKDKDADQDFLDVVTEECQTKATEWDQRSTRRASELSVLSDAIKTLTTVVQPAWSANKKLVDLQTPSRSTGHWMWMQDKPVASEPRKALSFLQARGSNEEVSGVVATRKVTELLSRMAARLNSNALSAAAVRVEASQDHFVKVRSIIKDLISRLEDDADKEQTQKTFCDEQISAATSARDEAIAEIEQLSSTKSQLEAEKNMLTEDIALLGREIADLNKALNEAAELREAESAENKKTVETAAEGKQAVELCLDLLNKFYEKKTKAFIQTKYVPPDSDREGKTVGDRAPEVWDGDYQGKFDPAKGITGLLQVILSDFSRTIDTVNAEEENAKEKFTLLETKVNKDIFDKTESKKLKASRISEIEQDLSDNANDLSDEDGIVKSKVKELAELHAPCVQGEETYAERVAKREKEIESLKEALTILNDWQN